MIEFVRWRGDLTYGVSPPCEIDALIFSQFSYLHFRDALGECAAPLRAAAQAVEGLPREPGNPQVVADRHALLKAARNSARFGALTVGRCEDQFVPQRNMQFAAVTFALPDGSHILAYRGTDATVVGWREDFNLFTACPVPSQTEALRYLEAVASDTAGKLRLCGHSKGGNLAMYAAACCPPEVRARIADVYLFDAPGLDAATTETDGYREALARTRCFVPQASVVGRLMGVPDAYTVVRSTAAGISQHNTFTWALNGPRFDTLPSFSKSSQLMKATVDEFLQTSTADTRQAFVDTLFSILGAGNAHTLGEVAEHWTDTAGALWQTIRGLDPATRKALLSVAAAFASSGVENARKLITAERENRDGEAKPAGEHP